MHSHSDFRGLISQRSGAFSPGWRFLRTVCPASFPTGERICASHEDDFGNSFSEPNTEAAWIP